MPFVDRLKEFGSVAIVGLDKNCGKTECLNYLLNRLNPQEHRYAITSIGIDGERRDQVTQTDKPEIELRRGMLFVTSELHYRSRQLLSDLLDVDHQQTALGRLLTAEVLTDGKLLLSGPSDTVTMRRFVRQLHHDHGVQTTIVDGALSRMSLASPAVTEAMVLATGAAVSINLPQLVRRTAFVHRLVNLPSVDEVLRVQLEHLNRGVYAINDRGDVVDLHLESVLMIDRVDKALFEQASRFYVAGVVSDKLLDFLRMQRRDVELIVHDFSRVFASQKSYDLFVRSGGSIRTVYATQLLAVTVNPLAPSGYCLDSDQLKGAMEDALGVPVYDVKREAEQRDMFS